MKSICTCIYIHAHMNTYAHMYTGWRRLIGCLKLQVIFRKRATNYRALLRKMTYEDKASYDSSPPCTPVSPSPLHVRTHTHAHAPTHPHKHTHKSHVHVHMQVLALAYIYMYIYPQVFQEHDVHRKDNDKIKL